MTNQPVIAGMGGYVGVDFNMFEPLCNAYQIPESERRFLLDKIIILNNISGRFWRQEEKSRAEARERERKSQSPNRR
jgi:hypothetical protein